MRLIGYIAAVPVLAAALWLPAGAQDNAAENPSRQKQAVPGPGFILGYEEGFHSADLDVHMGRSRPVEDVRGFKDAGIHYRRPDDRKRLEAGYAQGFRAGYQDGISGRDFRKFDASLLMEAQDGVTTAHKQARSKDFTHRAALLAGYRAGLPEGATDRARRHAFSVRVPECSQGATSQSSLPNYCAWYGRGFRLGYEDGYR